MSYNMPGVASLITINTDLIPSTSTNEVKNEIVEDKEAYSHITYAQNHARRYGAVRVGQYDYVVDEQESKLVLLRYDLQAKEYSLMGSFPEGIDASTLSDKVFMWEGKIIFLHVNGREQAYEKIVYNIKTNTFEIKRATLNRMSWSGSNDYIPLKSAFSGLLVDEQNQFIGVVSIAITYKNSLYDDVHFVGWDIINNQVDYAQGFDLSKLHSNNFNIASTLNKKAEGVYLGYIIDEVGSLYSYNTTNGISDKDESGNYSPLVDVYVNNYYGNYRCNDFIVVGKDTIYGHNLSNTQLYVYKGGEFKVESLTNNLGTDTSYGYSGHWFIQEDISNRPNKLKMYGVLKGMAPGDGCEGVYGELFNRFSTYEIPIASSGAIEVRKVRAGEVYSASEEGVSCYFMRENGSFTEIAQITPTGTQADYDCYLGVRQGNGLVNLYKKEE